jgi:hypothetical protein
VWIGAGLARSQLALLTGNSATSWTSDGKAFFHGSVSFHRDCQHKPTRKKATVQNWTSLQNFLGKTDWYACERKNGGA